MYKQIHNVITLWRFELEKDVWSEKKFPSKYCIKYCKIYFRKKFNWIWSVVVASVNLKTRLVIVFMWKCFGLIWNISSGSKLDKQYTWGLCFFFILWRHCIEREREFYDNFIIMTITVLRDLFSITYLQLTVYTVYLQWRQASK